MSSLTYTPTHCCTWPAESRSDLHNKWSWLVIWARPTDSPQYFSTCCSHILLSTFSGGHFQSAAGMPEWASIDSCNACEADVFLGRRQTWPITNDVYQRWETVDQVTSFSPGLQHLRLCHTILCQNKTQCLHVERLNPVTIYFVHCPCFGAIRYNRLHKWAVNPELSG